VSLAKQKAEWDNIVVFYTYILRLQNAKFYVGYSSNLKQRYEEHNQGKVSATKKFIPAKLVFYAAFESKLKALAFEKYLKSHSGFAFRNKHFI
jgi:putative endonuclease